MNKHCSDCHFWSEEDYEADMSTGKTTAFGPCENPK